MKRLIAGASLILFAAAIPVAPAIAQAAGTPQRSSEVPPGLANAFAKAAPGIMRAIIAIEGSNSRLEDLPVSP